jgi:hypothetical protein
MAGDPFTIRIFVLDGDPEGVRFIDQLNWTGLGIVFPRSSWTTIRQRGEFSRAGVYVLTGYKEGTDEQLPTIYVGEGEIVRERVEDHYKNKDFWDRAVVFTASNNALNKVHVKWLENALVQRAREANQSSLDNGNEPPAPSLSEAERADTQAFLRQILQILPLLGVRAFEIPRSIAAPSAPATAVGTGTTHERDTVIVPALPETFQRTFLGKDCWFAIRISGGMLTKIKYIAAYITAPEQRITHYAAVANIEPYGEEGKYRLNFAEPAKGIGPILLGNSVPVFGPKYTTFRKLQTARTLGDLF